MLLSFSFHCVGLVHRTDVCTYVAAGSVLTAVGAGRHIAQGVVCVLVCVCT